MSATDQISENGKERNVAIVLSAGKGNRMHTDIPKQYLDLCGKPVIAWSLQAFETFDEVDEVILVCAGEDIEYCRTEIVEKYGFCKVRSIIPGGAERYLSVWEGLKEAARLRAKGEGRSALTAGGSDMERLRAQEAGDDPAVDSDPVKAGENGCSFDMSALEVGSCVFIHDGARPLIDSAILHRALEDVRQYHACVVGMPVKDTIKVADENAFAARTPDRRFLWQIQTPQVFTFSLVYEAYRKLIEEGIQNVTDDAMVVERETDVRVKLTEGSYRNIKITTPEDLEIARLFREQMDRDT